MTTTIEDVERLKPFIERGDKTKIANMADVGNGVVTDFFQGKFDQITTGVQIRIIDATLALIDEKGKLMEIAKEKIKSLPEKI